MTSSESWCPLAVWCQPMAASSSLTNSDRLRGQTIIVVSCDTETQAGDIKSGKYEAVSPALNKQQHMCGGWMWIGPQISCIDVSILKVSRQHLKI